MSKSDDSDDAEAELWGEIEPDLEAAFGTDADVTVHPAGDHLDVRVLPQSVKDRIEENHEGVEVVPYSAFRMTVRRKE